MKLVTNQPITPDWIRDFRYPGYTNAFSFLPPDCTGLYGTETLFGNWESPILLLAKDFAPTATVRDKNRNGEKNYGWCHNEKGLGSRTNNRLQALVKSHDLPVPLYGSALANILYDAPGASRSLPSFYDSDSRLHRYLAQTLWWVIGNMPNLQVIACIGQESWYLTAKVLGQHHIARCGSEFRDQEKILTGTVNGRTLAATCHFHPSRGSRSQWAVGWTNITSLTRQMAA